MSTEQSLVDQSGSNVAKIQNHDAPQGIAPMVQMVASGQITIEQLDHLMGLQERHEAAEAKRQYNAAMAKFRAEVPAALKDGKGQQSTYATLGSVMSAINGPLGNNGFNVDFRHAQDMKENTLTVTCTITHSGGHSESTDLTVKVEKLGSANVVQSLGGNVSYLKRYCVTSLTGLATEDDDGRSTGPSKNDAPERPVYTDERLKEMWPKWVERIKSGNNESSTIINQISKGFILTNDQMKKLMSLSEYDQKKTTLTDKEFSAAFKGWMASVESGEYSPDDLIKSITDAHELTDKQAASVNDLHDCTPVAPEAS